MLRLDPVWSDGNVALSLITKIASDRAFLCINRQMVASLRECRCRDSAVEQPLLHLRYRKFGVDAAFAARSARVHRARCNGCKIEVDVLTQYVDRTATIAVAGVAVQSRGDHFGICSTSVFASAAHGRALAIVRSDHDVHDKFRAGSRILSLAETYCPDEAAARITGSVAIFLSVTPFKAVLSVRRAISPLPTFAATFLGVI